jgi:tRNA(Ile)-lysidine synthase TilS/MesJ
MAAREQRYAIFEKHRITTCAKAIAVAHHRDDSAETMLLNLTRGTGIKGLRGIQARNGNIIRPLLCVGRDEILDLIAKMHRELGITVILVSHSMEDVAKYVDRIIVMNQGEVLYDGVPKDVFSQYKTLEQVGLAAPQVTYLMHELREKGLPVDLKATTVEEARDSILRALRGR